MSGWYGFDLDGTLAYVDHDKPYDPYAIGQPIMRMVHLVRQYRMEGYECRILTARASKNNEPGFEVDYERSMQVIKDWSEQHIGEVLPITAEKDYGMIALYDDRARQVIYNLGIVVEAR